MHHITESPTASHRNDRETAERLFHENMPLARWFAGRWRDLDPDDALQMSLMGLWKAAETFEEGRATFATHAVWKMRAEVNYVRLKRMTQSRGAGVTTLSLDWKYNNDHELNGDWKHSFLDRLADENCDPTKEAELSAINDMLTRAIAELKPKYVRVLRLYYGLDGREHSMDEIGRMVKVSRQRIQQIVARGLNDLRAKLKFRGYEPPRECLTGPKLKKHYLTGRCHDCRIPIDKDATRCRPCFSVFRRQQHLGKIDSIPRRR